MQDKLASIKEFLRKTKTGKELLAFAEQHKIPIQITGKTKRSFWHFRHRKVELSEKLNIYNSALILAHELYHAKCTYDSDSAVERFSELSRQEFINFMLAEEARAQTTEFEVYKEFLDIGITPESMGCVKDPDSYAYYDYDVRLTLYQKAYSKADGDTHNSGIQAVFDYHLQHLYTETPPYYIPRYEQMYILFTKQHQKAKTHGINGIGLSYTQLCDKLDNLSR